MEKTNEIGFVDEHITVRVDPHVYAFSTNTIPNYLKIGDTCRGVDLRIKEWEKILKKKLQPKEVILTEKYRHSSLIKEKDIFFRDYDVHKYLKEHLKKNSIDVTDPGLLHIYSKEFFKDVTVEDVQEAVDAIVEDGISDDPNKEFSFYSKETAKSKDFHWENNADWRLRPNQERVVKNYLEKKTKKELLMFAVMRFGKSFTAMQCALSGNKRKVLIVCAKADVQLEWQENVEHPKCFKDYVFISDTDLKKHNSIQEILEETGKDKYAMFLTLQNLSGKASDGSNIKNKLKSVFKEKFDLLIVDETHYGAWAKCYGSTISDEEDNSIIKENNEHDELIKECAKKIKVEQKLHLSGTPYNLLYDEKFSESNIIATYQFKDILRDKKEWDKTHFNDIENNIINPETGFPYQESDNPYFGFPQMLRFAFNLPDKWIKKLKGLSKSNQKWSLNDLFKTKKVNDETKFVNEEEVLGLLKAIDGSSNEQGILAFLDIPKIKNNDVCKHIVMVLPFRSSCDAMEQLLLKNKDSFINLSKYVGIINIAGRNSKASYSKIDNVKKDIQEYESNGQHTISLTVNRMLTGVTVKEWDTMLMLKNTKSAQEYDQATFRIQNQYVIQYEDSEGHIIKKDMKPQTILVDFDPLRMFEIQGLSTRIVDKVSKSDDTLDEAISEELSYFPIITFNADKLVRVEATNIIEIIMQYNRDESIIDKANSAILDPEILKNDYVKEFINSQYKAGLKNKLTEKAHKGKESKFSEPEESQNENSEESQGGQENTGGEKTENKELIQKFRMCIACILFYSFLTNSNVEKLDDIIPSFSVDSEELDRNKRLYKNLKLDKKFIKELTKSSSRMSSFNIDSLIKNANLLSKDNSLSIEDRAINALNKFSKISDSEIVSPRDLCYKTINALEVDKLASIINNDGKILDIASKTGEFAFALYDLLKDKVDIKKLKKSIYSIPTSTITYEFTRKIYEVLGLDTGCISNMTSFDLLEYKVKKKINVEKFIKEKFLTGGETNMKISVVIGNPPYQATVREATTGNNKNTIDIYQDFQDIALKLSDATCLIYPAKEYQRGTINTKDENLISLRIYNGSNREGEKHIPGESSVFGDAVRRIPGDVGLVYFNKDKTKHNKKILYQDTLIERSDKILPIIRDFLGLASSLMDYVGSFKFSEIKKVCESNFVALNKSDVIENVDRSKPSITGYSKVLTNDKAGSGGKSKWYYIKTNRLDRSPQENYKVIIPSARPNEGLANSANLEIISPDENFGRSKLCIYDNKNLEKTKNCVKYLSTKFAKAVNMMTPDKFLYYLPNFEAIYDKVDWNKSLEDIDNQLFALFKLSPDTINYIKSVVE